MKKLIKKFFLNEIVLITLLLLFSLVVYFFYIDFNLVLLLWIIQSGVIIFLKYRSSNYIIGKTKLDKVFIYFMRLLFLFIETLFCFEIFAIFFVISYKLFYKNYELILGLSLVVFMKNIRFQKDWTKRYHSLYLMDLSQEFYFLFLYS